MSSPRRARRMDPQKLPPELREFAPIFDLYGVVGAEDAQQQMGAAVQADPERFAELEEFARRFTPDKQEVCDAWLSRLEPGQSLEAAKVASFLTMLDALEVDFPGARGTAADLVEHALIELRTFDTVDARVDRMFAAQSLGERGPAVAARAADALRLATNDPAPEVAAWAHAALALVTGADAKAHRAAIAKLIDDCEAGSVEQSYAEDALAELDKPPAVRNLSRLCGACILNDLETIRELTISDGDQAGGRVVDVNARDQNGQSPIEYAVGNAHAAALELLLAAGADPNGRDLHGRPVLHAAAARRNGGAMIALLVDRGADVNARDAEGATAVTHALSHKRDDNAKLLREHGGTA